MTQKVSLLEFEQNSNIGTFMFTNDKFCLIGRDVESDVLESIGNVLDVPIFKVSILNSQIVGIYIAGNNDFLIMPEVEESEKEIFDKISSDFNIDIFYFNSKNNAFGNNLCVGEKEIISTTLYNKDFLKELSKKTGLKTHKIEHKDFDSIGSVCKFMKGKYFISQEFEEDQVKSIVKQVCGVGTVNSGSNYISAGCSGNKNGVLIGSDSSTIEIQNLVESFDYL